MTKNLIYGLILCDFGFGFLLNALIRVLSDMKVVDERNCESIPWWLGILKGWRMVGLLKNYATVECMRRRVECCMTTMNGESL